MQFTQQRTQFGEPYNIGSDTSLILFVECENPAGHLRLSLDLTQDIACTIYPNSGPGNPDKAIDPTATGARLRRSSESARR